MQSGRVPEQIRQQEQRLDEEVERHWERRTEDLGIRCEKYGMEKVGRAPQIFPHCAQVALSSDV